MPQLGGLDSCVAPSIILAQRVKEPLHLPFDFRCIGVHAALLPVWLRAEGLITYFGKTGKLFPAHSLPARSAADRPTRGRATPPPRSPTDHGGWRTPDRPPTGCRSVANGLTTPPHQPPRSPWPQPAVRRIASWPDSGSSGHAAARQWLAFALAWSGCRWLRRPGSPGNGPAARRRTRHEKHHRGRGPHAEPPCARRGAPRRKSGVSSSFLPERKSGVSSSFLPEKMNRQ